MQITVLCFRKKVVLDHYLTTIFSTQNQLAHNHKASHLPYKIISYK